MRSINVVKFGKPLQMVSSKVPKPKGTEVLLKVRAAGICHTDLHLWHGGYDLGNGRAMSLNERGVSLPLTMGHENVGEIIDMGEKVKGLESGGIHLVYPWLGCGACDMCLEEKENYCLKPNTIGINRPGGYSDYLLVPHPRYLISLNTLSPREAAPLACSGLSCFSALRKLDQTILKDRPLVVIGAGGLGLMSIVLAKALGCKGAIVIEPNIEKRKAALQVGALVAFSPEEENIKELVTEAAKNEVLQVLDFVGSEQTANLAFSLLAKGGHLVTLGLFGGAAGWPLPLLAINAITVQGSYVGSLPELRELVDIVERHRIKLIPTQEQQLTDVQQALEKLEEGAVTGRLVIVP